MRDRRGLGAQEYRFPWQALLRRDAYDERAAAGIRGDEAFARDLETALERRWPALVSLLEFCAGVPDFLLQLLERGNIPLNRVLTPEGTLRAPGALLKADRMRLLRQLVAPFRSGSGSSCALPASSAPDRRTALPLAAPLPCPARQSAGQGGGRSGEKSTWSCRAGRRFGPSRP